MTVECLEVVGDVVRRRRRWSRSEKEEIVLETLASGVTVTEVARRRGIDRTLLYRWRRELKVRRHGPGDPFLPVEIEREPDHGSADASGRMEIALAGGRRVTVYADVDAAALARVLDVLERR